MMLRPAIFLGLATLLSVDATGTTPFVATVRDLLSMKASLG